ncbi:MAG: PASTA domain-containing protein [Oscillospiraceae bacterium]|nr:PASTA domain-containing protein [Oscillospiraceae bacterium]
MAKNKGDKLTRNMLITTIFLTVVCFGILIGVLFDLQVLSNDELQSKAVKQQMSVTTIEPERGSILDRNQKLLAQSAPVWTVLISPIYYNDGNTDEAVKKDEEMKEKVADGLSKILDVAKEDILALTEKKSYELVVKRRIEKSLADKVRQYIVDNEIVGVTLREDSKRYYPYGSFASTVLGFTGVDNQGLSGIESYYEKYLKGTSGRVVASKNARGTDMPFKYETMYEPEDGYDLILTIDEVIQHYLEKHLETAVIEHKVGDRAVGIIMDVNNGEILGMTTKDDYDPNNPFVVADEETAAYIETLSGEEKTNALAAAQSLQWRNKAISDPYEPGSIFKVITASAALEQGVVKTSDRFYCGGFSEVAGTKISCWKTAGHGSQNFTEGLMNSCNPVFMAVGERLGGSNFFKYFKAFGFTEKTGIDLPGEAGTAGLYYTAEKLNVGPVELANESFGQSFKVTPIQIITAISAAVNGGKLYEPYIVKQIIDDDQNIISSTEPTVKRQVVSESVSKEIAMMMEEVVSTGSGKNAYVKGYRIGGKTATSEKLDKEDEQGEKSYRIASFIGIAPADDPQIAVLVILDEPHDETTYGSVLAAPVVGGIMSDVLPYLGIEPKYSAEELEKIDVTTPGVVGMLPHDAQAQITKQGLKCEILGEGEKVIKQIPNKGEQIPRGGMVVLYTEENYQKGKNKVPNVIGMTAQQANQALKNAGFNIRLSGAGLDQKGAIAVTQSYEAETELEMGTVIDVDFLSQEEG